MKKILLQLCFFNILLFSCQEKKKIDTLDSANTDYVITLNKIDNQYRDSVNFKDGGYMKTAIPKIVLSFKKKVRADEIDINKTEPQKIITQKANGVTLLQHKYNTAKFEFIFIHPNDKIEITYKNGVPIFKTNNKNIKEYDLNFESKLNLGTPPIDATEAFVKFKGSPKNEIDAYTNSAKSYYSKVLSKLDSLYQKQLISPEYYSLRKSHYTYVLNAYDKTVKLNFENDKNSYMYPLYRNYMIGVYNKYGITPKSNEIDFKKSYDKVSQETFNNSYIKDYLLSYYIESIASAFSIKDFEQYFSRFEKDVTDKSLISSLKQKYLYDYKNLKEDVKNLNLIGADLRKRTLKNIFEENKGKIIYVDFWASWCLPCRKAMPSSKKIREELDKKDIVFVYLSIDKDFDKWKSANTKDGLKFYKNSYLIANQENSEDFKKMGVQTIPKYLIYDKNGKLIYPNAPSPESSEIKKILNSLLEK